MPRPLTTRRIRKDLDGRLFKPQGLPVAGLERVEISLDGLEALRLADLEGLYQEEAARRMGVSRATFARVLTAARAAVAEALVGGKALAIEGGPVTRLGPHAWPCPVHGSETRRGRGCRCRRGQAGRNRPQGRAKGNPERSNT
jgi:predicted DNA-binding protein (UPF0251 family)